jgi:K+-sensing histidine kinase KdpD
MRQRRALRHSLCGALFCGTSAIGAAFVFRQHSFSLYLPIGFITVLLGATMLWDRVAGIVGSIVSTIAFTLFLFAPFGSLAVSDTAARMNLVCMLLAGFVVSYFTPPIGPLKN